jgi:hypothetical protein
MVIGVLTATPWIVVMATTITDMEAVQNAFSPSMEVFHQATGSKPMATFLQAYLTLLYYSKIRYPSIRISLTGKIKLASPVNGSPPVESHGHFLEM